MKSKLLMLLLAGFSMIMLPACGDDDDDAKMNQLWWDYYLDTPSVSKYKMF